MTKKDFTLIADSLKQSYYNASNPAERSAIFGTIKRIAENLDKEYEKFDKKIFASYILPERLVNANF